MIPKAIVNLHEHRQVAVDKLGLTVSSPTVKAGYNAGEDGVLSLESNEGKSVKERTFHAFLTLYEEQGYDVFLATAKKMKRKKNLKAEWAHFKGELAEAVLYITILEFIKVHKLEWKVYNSLVIPHKNGEKGATTECDLVIVSEEMITVFEAKSNSGSKTLTGVCTLNIPGREPKNIYNQNGLHCHSLIKQIEHLNRGTSAGMMSAYFLFDDGKLEDKRDEKSKRAMPALNEDSLHVYLSALATLKTKNWKPEIFHTMDTLASTLTMEDHRKYIQGVK